MTTSTDARGPAAKGRSGNVAALPVLLVLSFLCSIGTGIATTGVYFLTKQAYGFGTIQNYTLGLFQGLTYIAAAMVSGRVVRRLHAYGLSTRSILGVVIGTLGLLCFIPILAAAGESGTPRSWPIWVMVLLYSPLTGILWPVVEGYISGGRSGQELRRALGTWNLWWSSALVLGFFLMGPLLGTSDTSGLLTPRMLIALLGAVHILTLVIVARLPLEPGRHLEESHEPHPPVYSELLGTFRILLPTSYFVLTALQPYLPKALAGLSIAPQWIAPLAAVWLMARVVTFFALDRWPGWHGKWSLAIASIVLLIGGFAAAVLGPLLHSRSADAALTIALLGLAAFGVGMAMTYTAALYYAMEVGRSEVDAGGAHESLIGLGYAVGPAVGLLAAAWSPPGTGPRPGAFELRVVMLVGSLALLAFVAAAIHAHRRSRTAGYPR